jgi:hypothetical protein
LIIIPDFWFAMVSGQNNGARREREGNFRA